MLMSATTVQILSGRALFLAATLAVVSPRPAAGANERTTLVLHAVPAAETNGCFTPQDGGLDCSPGGRPSVSMDPRAGFEVYLYARNYDAIGGVQCAFDWPGDWQYLGWGPFSGSGCQSQQLNATEPDSAGSIGGTLTCAFDCVAGGFLAPLGFLSVVTGDGGCLSVIESGFPFGTHVLDCGGLPTPVDAGARGRVCVGVGGLDTCDFVEPVAPSSWGRVKAQYRRE